MPEGADNSKPRASAAELRAPPCRDGATASGDRGATFRADRTAGTCVLSAQVVAALGTQADARGLAPVADRAEGQQREDGAEEGEVGEGDECDRRLESAKFG